MKPSSKLPGIIVVCILSVTAVDRAAAATGGVVAYSGMCDASAAVMLDNDHFVVANDEDNVLRVYARHQSGPPLLEADLSGFLAVEGDPGEADIEGAARLGHRIYWIASHGANKNGKDRPARRQFFATDVDATGQVPAPRPIGRPYANLLQDLVADARLTSYDLRAASTLPPKEPGALNIEGLCATPEGHLLIGFRNPVPGGRALIVPLLNPGELAEGAPARLGDPMELDLGGLSIRSLEFWRGQYWIVAGAADSGGHSLIHVWDGTAANPWPWDAPELAGFNPEALVFYEEDQRDWLWIVSDDGNRPWDGEDCKKLKDAGRRQFRALTIPLDNGPRAVSRRDVAGIQRIQEP